MDRMAVTGGAGFIGSNLAEWLTAQGNDVVIIDDFSSGKEENLEDWSRAAGRRLEVVRANILETGRLRQVLHSVRFVFHLAAIPSVQSSISDPIATNSANIGGTLSVLVASRDAGVKRVVVASSCAVYGDEPGLPKAEEMPGSALSPYALSKQVCEQYCRLFHRLYGLETVSLRFFNVFGPRQDPRSDYAAVIPRFVLRVLSGLPPIIYGDGEQTRDFIHVRDVIRACWIAATHPEAPGEVFNVAQGKETSLNRLVEILSRLLDRRIAPKHDPARPGEIRRSVADISRARRQLQFSPAVSLEEGLRMNLDWYRTRIEATHDTA